MAAATLFRRSHVELLHALHAIFVDTQARAAELGCGSAATAARTALARDKSRAYRATLRQASAGLEAAAGAAAAAAGHGTAEAEALLAENERRQREFDTAAAVWQMAEAAFFFPPPTLGGGSGGGAASSSSSSSPSPSSTSHVLAFVECVRDNFMDVADEASFLRVLMRVRASSAAVQPGLDEDVWDLVALLVVTGQPRDAGKILAEHAANLNDARAAAFARLLLAYPALSASGVDVSGAYAAAWDDWRGHAQGARRASPAARPGDALTHVAAVQEAILDLLSGMAWADAGGAPRGLRRLPAPAAGSSSAAAAGDPSVSYADWPHLCLCSVLYGAQAPSTLGRSTLAGALAECLHACGEAVTGLGELELEVEPDGAMDGAGGAGGEDGSRGAAGIAGLLHDEGRALGLVQATLVACLEGDAVAPLRLLGRFGQATRADGHDDILLHASAHLADLLWHANHLDAFPVLIGADGRGGAGRATAGRRSPPRAHFLLEHARELPAYDPPTLTRVAVTYAAAAVPDYVLAGTGVAALTLRPLLLARGGAAVSPARVLLAVEAASLTPELRRAKLALLTGASPSAQGCMDSLLLAIPTASDAEAEAAMALAHTVNRGAVAQRIGLRWADRLAGGGGGGGSGDEGMEGWQQGVGQFGAEEDEDGDGDGDAEGGGAADPAQMGRLPAPLVSLGPLGPALKWYAALRAPGRVESVALFLVGYTLFTALEPVVAAGSAALHQYMARMQQMQQQWQQQPEEPEPFAVAPPATLAALQQAFAEVAERLRPVDEALAAVQHRVADELESGASALPPLPTSSPLLAPFLRAGADGDNNSDDDDTPSPLYSRRLHQLLVLRKMIEHLSIAAKLSKSGAGAGAAGGALVATGPAARALTAAGQDLALLTSPDLSDGGEVLRALKVATAAGLFHATNPGRGMEGVVTPGLGGKVPPTPVHAADLQALAVRLEALDAVPSLAAPPDRPGMDSPLLPGQGALAGAYDDWRVVEAVRTALAECLGRAVLLE
jgi:hypothetical protein